MLNEEQIIKIKSIFPKSEDSDNVISMLNVFPMENYNPFLNFLKHSDLSFNSVIFICMDAFINDFLKKCGNIENSLKTISNINGFLYNVKNIPVYLMIYPSRDTYFATLMCKTKDKEIINDLIFDYAKEFLKNAENDTL